MKKIYNFHLTRNVFIRSTFFLMAILLFYSCNKENVDLDLTEDIEITSSIDQIINQSLIPFAVEDNTLVFYSEEGFQKAIDFLNSIGDENFSKWENHYGFTSLRRSPGFDMIDKKTDNLFATLLNCNSEIIIGANKFKIDFDKEEVIAYPSEESNNGMVFYSELGSIYNFTDDVFSLLETGIDSKGTYCGGRDSDSAFPFYGWPGDHIYLRVRYYTIGIYNTVSIHMDQNFYYFDGYWPLTNGFYTNYGESTWRNKKDSGTFNNISESRVSPSYGDLLSRPYARTRRLKYLYLNVEFYTICTWNPTYNYSMSLDICCHSPGCAH